jgi:hypothetical protein
MSVYEVKVDTKGVMEALERSFPGIAAFLEETAYLAGGAVRDLLRTKNPNDYDIFFKTPEALTKFEEMFAKKMINTPFKNYQTTVLGTYRNYKVQFISMYTGSPDEVVGRFDWNINMVWSPLGEVPHSPLGRAYFPTNELRLNLNATHLFSAMERLPRFLAEGYRIDPFEMQKALVRFSMLPQVTEENTPQTFSSTGVAIKHAIEQVKEEVTRNSKLGKFLNGK